MDESALAGCSTGLSSGVRNEASPAEQVPASAKWDGADALAVSFSGCPDGGQQGHSRCMMNDAVKDPETCFARSGRGRALLFLRPPRQWLTPTQCADFSHPSVREDFLPTPPAAQMPGSGSGQLPSIGTWYRRIVARSTDLDLVASSYMCRSS